MEYTVKNFDWKTSSTQQCIDDVLSLCKRSEDFASFCHGELESGDVLYDSTGSAGLCGADVQDHLK